MAHQVSHKIQSCETFCIDEIRRFMTEFDLTHRLHPNPELLSLWREQQLVDAVLRADGQTSDDGLRAHRIVLSASSAYLRALFCSEHWRQRQPDGEQLQIVRLPALASDAVRIVVATIYLGKLEVGTLRRRCTTHQRTFASARLVQQ